MFRFSQTAVVFLGVLTAAPGGVAPAQSGNSALKPQIEQLLEGGWPRSLKARGEAQQQYQKLERQSQSDARIPYAYALVQLRQLRYADAARLIDQVVKADKQNLAAGKLKIWLAVITKEYDKALLEMPRVAALLPADEAADDAETPNLEVARFLGRIMGYLEGPAKEGMEQAARNEAVRETTARLTTRRKAAFENARKAVLQQFTAMGEEAEVTSAEAKQKAEKQKERMIGDLQRKTDELAAKAEADQARLEELKQTLTYEADKIDSDDRQLLPLAQQAEAQAIAMRRDLRVIDDRIAGLYDLANREKDPNQRQLYLNDAAGWQLRRNERAVAARDADRRLAEIHAQRVQLQQKRRDLDARWQRESGRAEKLHGTLKRTLTDKDKLEKQSVSGNTSQVSDQKRRSVALTTYVPLPVSLEEERTRLLETFK
jgi:hypothetical protein